MTRSRRAGRSQNRRNPYSDSRKRNGNNGEQPLSSSSSQSNSQSYESTADIQIDQQGEQELRHHQSIKADDSPPISAAGSGDDDIPYNDGNQRDADSSAGNQTGQLQQQPLVDLLPGPDEGLQHHISIAAGTFNTDQNRSDLQLLADGMMTVDSDEEDDNFVRDQQRIHDLDFDDDSAFTQGAISGVMDVDSATYTHDLKSVDNLLDRERRNDKTSVLSLPAEILVYHIIPLLDLRAVQQVNKSCKAMNKVAALSMSSCHPLYRYLQLRHVGAYMKRAPAVKLQFNILSWSEWNRHLFGLNCSEDADNQRSSSSSTAMLDESQGINNEDLELVRKSFYRLLSKRKKFVPLQYHDDLKWIVASLLRYYLHQTAQLSGDSKLQSYHGQHLTSIMYRSLSIVIGMYDKSHLDLPLSCQEIKIPDNSKYVIRMLHSSGMLMSNQHLLPSLIRSLFWIQKEKYHKKRTVVQVDKLFESLPGLLRYVAPVDDDSIRSDNLPNSYHQKHNKCTNGQKYEDQKHVMLVQRFVKIVSDEARSMRDKIQESFDHVVQEDDVMVRNPPDDDNTQDRDVIQDMNLNGREPLNDGQQPLNQDNQRVHVLPRRNANNLEQEDAMRDNDHHHGLQILSPSQARRALEPIRLAVTVCALTATLYPECFNAQTLATIIRNSFNLIAWGVSRQDIKYSIMSLCWRIIQSVSIERERDLGHRYGGDVSDRIQCHFSFQNQEGYNTNTLSDECNAHIHPHQYQRFCQDGCEYQRGREKLEQLIQIFDVWIPQIEWDLARETLVDVRGLFQVHLTKYAGYN
ncbi:hypothetical protein MP228_001819 [Amoeboaphelidium protococcarum]|nr:hypothetical protein MP228_001819 [Amoeboaphelidium protococcarum]